MPRRVLVQLLIFVTLAGCGSPQSTAGHDTIAPSRFQPSIDDEVADLFTFPFPEGTVPSGFKFAPNGRSLAYIRLAGENGTAVPQLRLLDLDSRTARALWETSSPTVGSFEWFPDGQRVLVNGSGNLYVVDAGGGAPRQLTRESAEGQQLSPDGRLAAFVRDHDLMVVDIESGAERQLTADGEDTRLNGEIDWVYEEELELNQGFWWAPGSGRIAFLQFDETPVTAYPVMVPGAVTPHVVMQRYPQAGEPNPHVRLGVLDLSTEGQLTPAWIDVGSSPGEEIYIARVGWTPDGGHLYVITLDRLQRVLRLSLLDPAGAEPPQTIIEERDEMWVNLLDEPRFLADGQRFLWRSEGDGHAHLYVHDLSGAQVRQLTSGPWEVSSVVDVNEEGNTVSFVANRAGPATYQLFSVPLEGEAEPRQVSTTGGCHDVTFSPDHLHFVDTHSALDRPPRAELFSGDGTSILVLDEGDLRPLTDLGAVHAEVFSVPGPDGIEYSARMFRPATLEKGRRYPALVWVYNGPGAQVVRDEWRTKYVPWMRLLARRGVVVFSMDGRGSYGRGRDWEKPIYGHLTEVELEDQLRGVEHLRSLSYIDGDRIGVFGWSYGATMVLSALLRHPGTFRVGVSVAPVTDWRYYDTIYTERYMMRPQDNPEGYERTALWPHAGQLADPLLLVHGLSDDNVHFRNTSQMLEALIDEGRRFDVMVYPGQSHGISAPGARRHVFSTVSTYILDHLLDGR